MAADEAQDITGLLAAWQDGDPAALANLTSLVYPKLRRIARAHLAKRPPGHTFESAALANEAYVKLTRTQGIRCESRTHFLALCSQMIRRILVDHARSRGYAKRGGGLARVTLDEPFAAAVASGPELMALDQALETLARIDARKVRVVELRFFGGLSVEETAQVLSISPDTVKRDWRAAKAWLFGALRTAP